MDIRKRPPNPKVKVANLEYSIPHNESKSTNILEEIIWSKNNEIEASKKKISLEDLKKQVSKLPISKDFYASLQKSENNPSIIAEIKKASPSKGIIRKDFKPIQIAEIYEEKGVSCISVLTDKSFFKGGFDVLARVRKHTSLPILCKDFIISPYQIFQARNSGADAILFIAAILNDQDLIYFKKIADSLGLQVLIEVHNLEELNRIIKLDRFQLIGINNRDLKTFQTNLEVTKNLSERFFRDVNSNKKILVSESGLKTKKDIEFVKKCGVRSVLIGESLMRSNNISDSLKELIIKS
tara:strand:+ start:8153 stop:9040 length:888 start_codon:yes stop_codon:yes gene_type:complete